MEQYTIFDMEKHICVRFLWCVVIILVTVQLVHTECPPSGTPPTQVAQMCTTSTVSGTVLYVDTSGASATVNETGTLCLCNVNASASSGEDLSVTIGGHIASCGASIVLAANNTNIVTTDEDNCMLTTHTVMVPTDNVITMEVEKLKEPYDAQFCAKYEIVGSTEDILIECFKSDRLAETTTTLPATTVTATTDGAPHTDTTSQTTLSTPVTISMTASQTTETTPYAATKTLSTTAQLTSPTPTNTIQTTGTTPPTSMVTPTTDTTATPSASTTSVVTSSSSTDNQTLSSTTINEELPGDGTSGKAATFRISYISVLVVLVSLAVAV